MQYKYKLLKSIGILFVTVTVHTIIKPLKKKAKKRKLDNRRKPRVSKFLMRSTEGLVYYSSKESCFQTSIKNVWVSSSQTVLTLMVTLFLCLKL